MSYRVLGEVIRRIPTEYASTIQPLDERVEVYVKYGGHGPIIERELDALNRVDIIRRGLTTGWQGMTRIVRLIAHQMSLIAPYNRPKGFDFARGFVWDDDGNGTIVGKLRSELSPEECEAWKKVDDIIQEVPNREDLPLCQPGRAEPRLS